MSDASIRKAERLARQTKSSADIAAYWRLALRAGILPKPNKTQNLPSDRHYYAWWALENEAYLVLQKIRFAYMDIDNVLHESEEWQSTVMQQFKFGQEALDAVNTIENEKRAQAELRRQLGILLDLYNG